ncbi:hypothetical protein TIFTF001_037746 [Ficus carica]|uniref:Cytochrome P450 n=1 Tax=Ficus carica TaxID=3494 RepID=A0AA88JD03_FICCA|nr:hypothetical protein TIFTF001_033192 [Ficus carica]GMN68692.1 hypothetical protein TIFTF001_037746 [Ficus carica]
MATITDAQYIIICFLLWLLSTLLLKSLFKKPSLHLPPSPRALPVIGHLHLFTTPLAVSTQTLAKKHGPLLYLRLGASRMLLVSSAPVAAEIFKTQDLDFSDRPSFAFADKLPYGSSGFFAAEYGDYWRFMKKVCMAELFAPRQLERSRVVRREEIGRFLHKVLEKCEGNDKKEKKDVVVLDMGAELMKLTNNTISRMAMSTSTCPDPEEYHGGGGADDEARKIGELIKKTQDLAVKVSFGDVLGPLKGLGFLIFGRKIIDVTMKYDEILEKMLMEHQERGKREGGLEREDRDLMDIILKLYEDDNAEIKIGRTQMKAFFLVS